MPTENLDAEGQVSGEGAGSQNLGDTGADNTGSAGPGTGGGNGADTGKAALVPEDGVPEEFVKLTGRTSKKDFDFYVQTFNYGLAAAEAKAKQKEPKETPVVSTEDPLEVLAAGLDDEIDLIDAQVNAGKIPKEQYARQLLKAVLKKSLGLGITLNDKILTKKVDQLHARMEEGRAKDFFQANPHYKKHEARIRTWVESGNPLGEILDLIDDASGTKGGVRQPSNEDKELAQLARERASTEGHVEIPNARGGATSGQRQDTALLDKLAQQIVEAETSGNEKKKRELLSKWHRAARGS